MGMILECYAIPGNASATADMRAIGRLVSSISINSVVAEPMLAPLVAGPLAGLDVAAAGPHGVLCPVPELAHLKAQVSTGALDTDIANTIADAVDEAQALNAPLWICLI